MLLAADGTALGVGSDVRGEYNSGGILWDFWSDWKPGHPYTGFVVNASS
jgi:hypothetical protein